ncbi:GLPGLI family protein [Rudanella paleaurantiibacter]|uniref:GLPGLI family protein n=1 Tax=Rudanella paleaurantiibacter TaxID=2614655 RepID=A0A7J5TTR4_9BACT|nr:GLPGLI family protein [Rudanella paleaurantiibacter]KAB7727288.1 GLPGLI family protein [Rudanella paleaurantiibacter]
MKTTFCFLVSGLTALLFSPSSQAQTTPTWAGQISYEWVQKIDPASLKFLDDNGELMKPSDPNFPKDIPDARITEQTVLINGTQAKVTRNDEEFRAANGPGGQSRVMGRPFSEQTYLDLNGLKKVTILTVGQGAEAKTYQAETQMTRISGWQQTDQTRKIAGYTCRKATVPFKKETYAVWFTTDLPFSYSPVPELTPEKGTVLLIEGSKEQFRATKIRKAAADPSVAKPNVKAQKVSPEQLLELRQKAVSDFVQKHARPGFGG